MNSRRPMTWVLAVLALALPPIAARAELLTISEMFVFGDSLSDAGNSGLATLAFAGKVFPPTPYADGRFSNGPTAVEYLWNLIGDGGALTPSLAGGTDFAIGGATTGVESYNEVNPNVPEELRGAYDNTSAAAQLQAFQSYASTSPFDPETSLFVIWLFPNDVLYANATGSLPGVVPGSPGGDNLISNGIANIATMISLLATTAGAENFLVINLPDMGRTPGGSQDPAQSAALSALSAAFNAGLAAQLDVIADQLGINLTQFFIDQLFAELLSNPASFGFTNASQACVQNLATCNPDEWVFWDSIHPTTRAHQIIADQIARAFSVAEPGTLVLLGLGLIVLAWIVRRSAD
jgi:phospholipase/lecithinase/hemolysin